MIKKFAFSLMIIFSISCTSKENEKPVEVKWSADKSSKFGKELTLDEEIDIQLYLAQHKELKMTKTGTGLQFEIYKKGDGDSAKTGRLALITYKISLLDGTLCYQTEKNELDKFIIDHSDVETGIQEGIKKLRVGDKVKLMIPSHLAHGLVGDMNKIPPLNPIIVDLELIKLR
ncbi:MAG: FKBP-type peptidyl-prolyl cis-trans isomerase [Flavobacteriia bacterium]|nr:FKBP-type peptidyl-prolyl cis-trans isomerase [Flavobacteriia bacterium]